MARVAIDARDLRTFARAMGKVSRTSRREFRRAEIEAGEIIAEEARAIAEQHSTRIPKTIKARSLAGNVVIEAGGDDAPHAVPFEVGNTGKRRPLLDPVEGGKFRHPVFGDRKDWVEQDMHPYLGPAAVHNEREALEKLGDGVNRAFESVRLSLE